MSDFAPNTVVQNLTLKNYLGAGQFGEVWCAYDNIMKKDVAVKFYVSLDKKGREEFFKEYELANSLKQDNLLSAMSLGEFENRPYLVLEYCPKGAASRLVGNLQPQQEEIIWRFVKDVAAGLAYLHNHDIVHQDIKPENVLENNAGRFIIADFGISTNVRGTMRKQSGRQSNVGSVAYMAPEKFNADPAIIKAGDIWALGASIYELATGKLPFASMGGVMQKNGAEIPEIVSKGYSDELNSLMHKCLALEPWDRIKAEEIAEKTTQKEIVKAAAHDVYEIKGKKKRPLFVVILFLFIYAIVAGLIVFNTHNSSNKSSKNDVEDNPQNNEPTQKGGPSEDTKIQNEEQSAIKEEYERLLYEAKKVLDTKNVARALPLYEAIVNKQPAYTEAQNEAKEKVKFCKEQIASTPLYQLKKDMSNGKIGYLNQNNYTVIDYLYKDELRHPKGGKILALKDESGKWGFVDDATKLPITDFKYTDIGNRHSFPNEYLMYINGDSTRYDILQYSGTIKISEYKNGKLINNIMVRNK